MTKDRLGRETIMKFARLLMLAGAIAVFSGVALADTVDPVIGVKGGTGSVLWTGSEVFNVSSDSSSGNGSTSCQNGICNFTSEVFFAGINLTNFDYLFSRSQNIGFSVADNSVFTMLQIISGVDSAHPEAILSGGLIVPPPPPCTEGCLFASTNTLTEFQLEMNGVIDGTSVTVTSNVSPVPEPGTIALLGSGLVGIGLRRLRRNRAAASSAS
jgi:hypothetical protein